MGEFIRGIKEDEQRKTKNNNLNYNHTNNDSSIINNDNVTTHDYSTATTRIWRVEDMYDADINQMKIIVYTLMMVFGFLATITTLIIKETNYHNNNKNNNKYKKYEHKKRR
ncbi:hypothetical protein HELRODRAFT_165563 [Helobdella robusta]|uniref:Uncharacterized protein n=1 Tax=Helobdella robusta TaxID=6412 RepID=T1EX06_HELRO|nr:hypothetical protein HELRODRAFT_165563 [Helobdella robusta]ESN91518.1 hypothetical protein HELRODRAFT_165563 [Helobdella robusta]